MIEALLRFCLQQRLLVAVMAALLCLGGGFAMSQLPIDAFPDVSNTQVKIILKAPGMTPEEVETRITIPIEMELLGIPKQRLLRSQSKYAITDVTVDFEDGTDIYWARQQVTERLNGVLGSLPNSVSGGLAPITTPLGEVFMFTIDGPQSLLEKRTLLDWVIRPQLRGIAGVADVNALGGHVKSFVVEPDPNAMAARKVSMEQLKTALEKNNRNDGAGRLQNSEESLLVRADGSIRSLDDVGMIAVAQREGRVVRVSDVARIRIDGLTRYGTVTQNGQQEAVEGLVLSLRGANARQVVQDLETKLAEIEKTLPQGTHLTVFYNRGDLVQRAVKTVAKALTEAIVLVLILLYAFLGNVRAALVVAVILPLSALLTFIGMQWLGLSANLMSLGGLAIAIGMLVDAAVVVVENMESHIAQGYTNQSWTELLRTSVQEVSTPIISGIVIIALVFLPLLTLRGLEGKLFGPVALTIVLALGSSLLLSLTLIPVLASFLLSRHAHPPLRWLTAMEQAYARLLQGAFDRKKIVYGAAGIAALSALVIFPLIGKSFLPTLDEGDLIMQVEKIPSIDLNKSAQIDMQLQKQILAAVPDVKQIVARVGSDELGLDAMGPNDTDTFIVLKPRDQWKLPSKEAIVDAIRSAAQTLPGMNYSFTQPIEMRTSEMLSGVRADVAIKIFGTDIHALNALAEKTVKALESMRGAEDVLTVQNSGVQYMQVQLQREALSRLGLSVEEVQNTLKAMVEGQVVGTVIEQGRRLPLLIRSGASIMADPDAFEQVRLPMQDGASIPLSQVARLEQTDGPVRVDRENGSRMAVVRTNVRDRDLVGFVDEAKALLAKEVPLPEGYRMTWGGQFENQQRAARQLALVIPVALVLIFLLLFTTIGSVRQATLVLVNIPFALVGGVFSLGITGTYLSVPASVGFIALMGIAVLNGLVMVTAFNQLRQQGMDMHEAVHTGARRRLRPVLMTASITALGLIPLLLATGPGSEIQKPLAIVVLGGLVTATALTLILLPLLFERFADDVHGVPQ